MREIKFRAWDTTAKKMYDISNIEGYPLEYLTRGDTPYTKFMQYTGLKDKAGTEIFEGDIIAVDCDCDPGDYAVCHHPPTNYYVDWFNDSASYELRYGSGKLSDMEFEDDYQDVYEVIGNKWDNPELLK